MSIFREFGGKSSYYTESELDRLQNPEKYDYDQESYDAFSAQVQKKADSRQAAAEAAQDAIPFSYVGRGTGATNPAFSFAGYSGQTSGGTSGLSGMGGLAGLFGAGTTTETTGQSTGDQGENQGGGGGPRDDGGGNVQHKAEGGMITSPYANPRNRYVSGNKRASGMNRFESNRMGGPAQMPIIRQEQPGNTGIGGMFEKMHQQFGQQMNQMQSSPLNVYSNYLNQTYSAPQAQEMQAKVAEFVDLVDQAERAHFGVEESFGYGRPSMGGQIQTMGPGSMGGGIASIAMDGFTQYPPLPPSF